MKPRYANGPNPGVDRKPMTEIDKKIKYYLLKEGE